MNKEDKIRIKDLKRHAKKLKKECKFWFKLDFETAFKLNRERTTVLMEIEEIKKREVKK